MPRIADYSPVRDLAFTLAPGEHREFSFNLNNDANVGVEGVLVFRMHAHSGPSRLGYRVAINGKEVFRYPFELAVETCQTINELIDAAVLKAGGVKVPNPNTIRFDATGNAGRMTISDVVVLFQRDI
jgi:hypothetical protein